MGYSLIVRYGRIAASVLLITLKYGQPTYPYNLVPPIYNFFAVVARLRDENVPFSWDIRRQ